VVVVVVLRAYIVSRSEILDPRVAAECFEPFPSFTPNGVTQGRRVAMVKYDSLSGMKGICNRYGDWATRRYGEKSKAFTTVREAGARI
jgi:hypothetical protein